MRRLIDRAGSMDHGSRGSSKLESTSIYNHKKQPVTRGSISYSTFQPLYSSTPARIASSFRWFDLAGPLSGKCTSLIPIQASSPATASPTWTQNTACRACEYASTARVRVAGSSSAMDEVEWRIRVIICSDTHRLVSLGSRLNHVASPTSLASGPVSVRVNCFVSTDCAMLLVMPTPMTCPVVRNIYETAR